MKIQGKPKSHGAVRYPKEIVWALVPIAGLKGNRREKIASDTYLLSCFYWVVCLLFSPILMFFYD